MGKLKSCNPDIEFVTISNSIKPYNTAEAAFVLRNCYKFYPSGSIHIIAVGTDPVPDSRILLAHANDHYFLSADNGIIGLLGDSETLEVYSLGNNTPETTNSFPELHIMAEVACRISKGEKPSDVGKPVDDYLKQIPLRATLENNTITGTIIYLDSYGNAITNISRELFERIGNQRKYEIFVQSKHYRITRLNAKYSETTPGDLLAIFNSIGLLEIAIRNSSARELLNLNTDSTVRVEFND